LAHHVISLRCGIWSLSARSGLANRPPGRFSSPRFDAAQMPDFAGFLTVQDFPRRKRI